MRALSLALALALIARPASADDLQLFEVAEARFRTGQYEEAATRFGELLGKSAADGSPEAERLKGLQQEARPMYAACLIALGRMTEADAVILTHLRGDPRFEPTPGQFADAVTDRFAAVRAENRVELQRILDDILEKERQSQIATARVQALQAKRLADLEKLAAEETVEEPRSRWIAAIPFGVGQFQNGDTGLGVFFATSETLAVVSSIVSASVAFDRATVGPNELTEEGLPVDRDVLKEQYEAARLVNWISLGSAAALALAGVIEAEVALEPAVTHSRKRPTCGPKTPPGQRCVPPPVKIEPAGAVTGDAVLFGASVHF